jgi:drug/metabolite transporter (DMT)-like permease
MCRQLHAIVVVRALVRGRWSIVAEFVALVAAALFGLGTVLQQRGTLQTSAGAAKASFYVQILRRPVWLAGVLVTLVGGVLQLVALNKGPLIEIQPIFTLSLVFALPFGAWLTAQQIGRREVGGAVLVVVGLALFLTIANPTGGTTHPAAQRWAVAVATTTLVALALILVSRHRRPPVVAALVGAAAGACFGLEAGIAKVFTTYVSGGVAVILQQWETYGLIVFALAGGALQQAALKTGVLPPAMSAINVANVIASIGVGLAVYQETVAPAGGRGGLALAALGLTCLGVMLLVRLRGIPSRDETGQVQPTST